MIWEFWESKPVLGGPKLFLSTYQARNYQNMHISFKRKTIEFLKLINEGFKNFNLATNFQKRIKCAARLLDRLEQYFYQGKGIGHF